MKVNVREHRISSFGTGLVNRVALGEPLEGDGE